MLFKGSSVGVSKSVVNSVLILSAILLVLWIITLSQSSDTTPQQTTIEEQGRIDTLRKILGNSESQAVEPKSDNLFNNAFPVFLILILGVTALWWWNQKKNPQENVISNVVAEQEIGPGQFIKVISLGDEYLVLGVTSQSINLLKSVSKQDWNPSALVNHQQKPNSIFSQFLNRAEGKNDV